MSFAYCVMQRSSEHAQLPLTCTTNVSKCYLLDINTPCFRSKCRLPFAEGQAHLNLFLRPKGCSVGLPYNDMTFERQSPPFLPSSTTTALITRHTSTSLSNDAPLSSDISFICTRFKSNLQT